MPKNKDLRKRVSDTIETRWAENARVTQLLKDKLSQSLDNVSMIGNKLKTIKITIPAKHYYYNVSHIQPRKDHEADEYVLFDDKEEIMSCTDDSYVDKFSNYILNKINEELEMSSIYEQMNKIDDNESLDEKYNVRTLKDVKKLQESTEHSDAWKSAYSKLNRAAEDAKLHMDPDFVEYALEDDGAYVEDVIENEVTYVGDVLKKEFPNLAYWKFLQDERFSSAIQVYSRPKNSRRFSDVTFEGNYELVHDRLYPIDVE